MNVGVDHNLERVQVLNDETKLGDGLTQRSTGPLQVSFKTGITVTFI